MKPSDFKIGDRVRIVKCKSWPQYNGTVGTIYQYSDYYCCIKRDTDHKELHFQYNDDQIELVNDWHAAMISNTNAQLSTQSPQPQQTQQKEDTVKPYAVIYLSLSAQQNASINGFYATEAEAKEAAEQLVANQRSNLTTKQYFAVTIVNTKTGKLVGSVVDAPPAVDWATS